MGFCHNGGAGARPRDGDGQNHSGRNRDAKGRANDEESFFGLFSVGEAHLSTYW